MRFNGSSLSKTSLAKNLQLLFRGEGGIQPFYKTCVPQAQVKSRLFRVKYLLQIATGGETGQPKAANMRHLTWDENLAVVAQHWADQCKFEHDAADARYA